MKRYEVEDLAIHLCGINEDEDDYDIEDAIYDFYDCSFESFEKIASDLLKMVIVYKSPLTEKTYKGFGANGVALATMEIKEGEHE